MFMKQYAPNRCEPSVEVSVRKGVGHGAYNQRIKVIAKMLKKKVGWAGEGVVRVVMNKELKLLLKLQKKVVGGPVQSRDGGQSGCERRKCKKKEEEKKLWMGSSLREGGGGGRIEVIVKMQEKKSEGDELARVGVNEIRIYVNEELKLLRKCKKRSEGVREGVGWSGWM